MWERSRRATATWLILATWKFVKELPNSLWFSPWLSEWLNDWQTYAANDNWNCLWLPTWFQFREKGKTTDKRTVTIFASLLMRFSWKRPPKNNPKTQQFPGLMGLRAAWERSLETTSQWQQAEATLNRFRVVVWHLTDKLPQFADDDDDEGEGEGSDSLKAFDDFVSLLCVYMLQHFRFRSPLYLCITPSGIHSLWQMCVDCWLKLPNWQTAEKRRQRLENRKKS